MILFGVSRLQELVELVRTDTPLASTTVPLIRLGATFSGGQAGGTYVGINAPSGFSGAFIDYKLDGAVKHIIASDGRAGYGTGLSTANFVTYSSTHTDVSFSRAAQFNEIAVGTSGNRTVYASFNTLRLQTAAGDVQGLGHVSQPLYEGVSATTQTFIAAFEAAPGINGASPTGTINELARYRANTFVNAATGTPVITLSNAYGLLVENMGATGGGVGGVTITNAYGIRVRAQSGAGTSNVAIRTDGGTNQFLSNAATVTPLFMQANAGQTAEMLQVGDAAGTARFAVGSLVATGDPTLRLRAISGQSGGLLSCRNSSNTEVLAIGVSGRIQSSELAVFGSFVAPLGIINAVASSASQKLCVLKQAGSHTGDILDCRTSGDVALFTIQAGGHHLFAEGVNVAFGTATGTKLGTSASQKIGAYNATPVVQPASANQAALTDSTGGTADGTVQDVGVVFSQSTLNNNFADIIRLVNQLRNDLTTLGWIKGSA